MLRFVHLTSLPRMEEERMCRSMVKQETVDRVKRCRCRSFVGIIFTTGLDMNVRHGISFLLDAQTIIHLVFVAGLLVVTCIIWKLCYLSVKFTFRHLPPRSPEKKYVIVTGKEFICDSKFNASIPFYATGHR